MTNKTKGPDYSKATPDLVKKVKEVITDSAKRTYSVSKVYGAYNEAYGLNETPQSCTSCLVNRAALLAKWMVGYEAWYAQQDQTPADPDVDFELGAVPLGAEEVAPATELEPTPQHKENVDLADGSVIRIAEYSDGTRMAYGEDGEEVMPLATGEYRSTSRVYTVVDGKITDEVPAPEKDPNNPEYDAPAPGVIRIPMPEGAPIDLTLDEGAAPTDPVIKGAVKYADGNTVKPGTYATAAGAELAVQVGGRGTLKVKEENLT